MTTALHLLLILLFVSPFVVIVFGIRTAQSHQRSTINLIDQLQREIAWRIYRYARSRFARPLRWMRRHVNRLAYLLHLILP